MDDAKRTYRDVEENTKEAWRNRDGEDLADKVGNAGDDIRKNLGNAGDDIRHGLDEAGNKLREEGDRLGNETGRVPGQPTPADPARRA